MDHRVYLKVKLKSLAAEARIIRKEEKKGGPHREGLYRHRIDAVRPEARHTMLAYNFIRGRTYQQTEQTAKPVDVKKVRSMVKAYGLQFDWNECSEKFGGDYKNYRAAFDLAKEEELKRLDAWLSERK